MVKKFLKQYMPDHEKIRNHKQLNQIFGKLLHDPNLLHLNRRSVSGAFFVGLLYAFMPLPSQMIFAAGTAIWARVNLPISVGLVWITNPVTMPPIFYFCYKVGTWILNTPMHDVNFELSWDWLSTEMGIIWQPFLLGCAVVGITAGTLGWASIRLLWRIHIVRQYRTRKVKRLAAKANKQP